MTTFNGIGFDVDISDKNGWQPDWRRQTYYSRKHYPDTNTDELQFGGLGNKQITVLACVDSAADVATLQGYVGSTYALNDFLGSSYASATLLDLRIKGRRPWAEEYEVELDFDVEAA